MSSEDTWIQTRESEKTNPEGHFTKHLVCALKITSLTVRDAVGAPLATLKSSVPPGPGLACGICRGHTGHAGAADNPGDPDLAQSRGAKAKPEDSLPMKGKRKCIGSKRGNQWSRNETETRENAT